MNASRFNKLLIGKDIDRTAALVPGAGMDTVVANIVEGEVVVLDKNKKVLAAGATVADSDTIYLAEGTSETFDYTNEAGTTVTGARKVIFSDPIKAGNVKSYLGEAYAAKAEQVITFAAQSVAPVVGTEYFLRVIYKDTPEHPGQFTQTYRFTATTTTAQDVYTGIRARIASHTGSRITGSGTTTLILTAKANPKNTNSLNDIDEFKMVHFDAFLNYVDSNGNWQTVAAVKTDTTPVTYGNGNWEQIRDLEKTDVVNRGVKNLIKFPIIKPDFRTVKSNTYNSIVIEHDKTYTAPTGYSEKAPLTTYVAMTVPSAGTQQTSLLAVLNPWMASCPGAFENVTL